MTWREYHQATKHSLESLRRARHILDWTNMPDRFRHYEGVPVLDLPADPPAPEIPALDVLQGAFGTTPVGDGSAFLSKLLFYSAAISASKLVPSTGEEYALRVNPSSGNLHPTEFTSSHGVCRGGQTGYITTIHPGTWRSSVDSEILQRHQPAALRQLCLF